MAHVKVTTHQEIAYLISQKKRLPLARILETKDLQKLGLDLLDIVDLILEIEKRYHMVIPDEVPLHSINDFVRLINQQNTLRKF